MKHVIIGSTLRTPTARARTCSSPAVPREPRQHDVAGLPPSRFPTPRIAPGPRLRAPTADDHGESARQPHRHTQLEQRQHLTKIISDRTVEGPSRPQRTPRGRAGRRRGRQPSAPTPAATSMINCCRRRCADRGSTQPSASTPVAATTGIANQMQASEPAIDPSPGQAKGEGAGSAQQRTAGQRRRIRSPPQQSRTSGAHGPGEP